MKMAWFFLGYQKNRLDKAIVKEGEFIFTHVGEIKLTLKVAIGGRGSPAFMRTQP